MRETWCTPSHRNITLWHPVTGLRDRGDINLRLYVMSLNTPHTSAELCNCLSLCIRLSKRLLLLQAGVYISVWMAATSQEDTVQIAANKWPACSQTGSPKSSWLRAVLQGHVWNSERWRYSSELQIALEWNIAIFSSLWKCVHQTVQHVTKVLGFFLFLFLLMLLLRVNITFLFKASSSVKEAYIPNPQGSDVLLRSPPRKLLTRIWMHTICMKIRRSWTSSLFPPLIRPVLIVCRAERQFKVMV